MALSQVRSSEAKAVFQSSILPVLENASDPKVTEECLSLMKRWTITGGMSPAARDDLASRLVTTMTQTGNVDPAGALAPGLAMVAPRLGSAEANELASVTS
ncbi:MAG TPA: hypothetical protein VMB85_26735 [Bryobacteraceae bacterium]|nr:hypothetical protein [Bryobacteraceae bacterium]